MYPILAIDYGLKHIGLAYSDSKGIVASPLPVLNVTKNRDIDVLVQDISQICKEYRIKSILIGYPQSFSENQDINIKRIDKFLVVLTAQISLPINKWDESFSTSDAKNMLVSLGQHFKKTKKKIDSVAASTFLQEYLNRNKNV